MKITKKILKKLILEELQKEVVEMPPPYLKGEKVKEPAPQEASLEEKLAKLTSEDQNLVMKILDRLSAN